MRTVTVDTTIAAGVLESDMLGIVAPGLTWAPNAKFNVGVFDASSGITRQLTLAVAATENLTIPAGTFSVYRIEVTGAEQPQTMFVTATAPHRIVKTALTGQPVEFVLVK